MHLEFYNPFLSISSFSAIIKDQTILFHVYSELCMMNLVTRCSTYDESDVKRLGKAHQKTFLLEFSRTNVLPVRKRFL